MLRGRRHSRHHPRPASPSGTGPLHVHTFSWAGTDHGPLEGGTPSPRLGPVFLALYLFPLPARIFQMKRGWQFVSFLHTPYAISGVWLNDPDNSKCPGKHHRTPRVKTSLVRPSSPDAPAWRWFQRTLPWEASDMLEASAECFQGITVNESMSVWSLSPPPLMRHPASKVRPQGLCTLSSSRHTLEHGWGLSGDGAHVVSPKFILKRQRIPVTFCFLVLVLKC